ncbi:MAG: FAD-binding oxidoreductase [Verrucomicrobiota bacterium]
MPLPTEFVDALSETVPPDQIIFEPTAVKKRSRDYYWFSPKLEEDLSEKSADAVYQVRDTPTLREVVGLAFRHEVPLHLRGGATGNFGQAVPLCGGLLIDFSSFDKIVSFEGDEIWAQAGTRCRTIEDAAREKGFEMPCYPSTWAKATIAGFAIGGSGGIGGMKHGLLQHNQMIRELSILTIEAEPKEMNLKGDAATDLIHSFGSVALVTAVKVKLAPKDSWEQAVVCAEDFHALFSFAKELALDRSIPLRTMCFLEDPLPSYCQPIRKHLPDDQHALLLEVSTAGWPSLKDRIEKNGYTVPLHIPHQEPRRSPMLSDFVQGHSLLWAMKADKRLASVSVFLSIENWAAELDRIREQLDASSFIQADFHRTDTELFMQSSILFPYKGQSHLEASLQTLREMGILRFNSHDPFIGSKLNPDRLKAKLDMKAKLDPHGLLSPGRFGAMT